MSQQPMKFRLPNVTAKQLLHFVVAAESGKLAEAGRTLRMAPSAISHSIDQLEATLGVQLCVRHKAKGLVLTSSGEAALTVARNLLTDLNDFETLFGSEGYSNSGRIIVGCSTPIAPKMLPTTHSDFALKFPNATVAFLEEHHAVLQEQLLQGRLDLAFMYDIDLDHRLERIPLMTMTPRVLLPVDHPLAGPDAPAVLSLEMVADEPFVIFGGTPMYERYLKLFAAEGITPNIAYTCRSMATLRSFVGRGTNLGLQFENYGLAMSVDGLEVVAKPLAAGAEQSVSICIALPRDSKPSVLSREWIVSARKMFGGGAEAADAHV